MALPSGARLGPYEIVAAIGAGGMGEVFKARDTRLGRDVAIKVLPADFASDRDRLHRFEQEARTVAALSHPNVLAVYDVGTNEGSPFLVTELLEGRTLAEELRAGALTVGKALEIGRQIAQGVAAAHARNIVHRDLKPSNVFLTFDGHVKLLDFGIAKLTSPADGSALGEATTETATGAGTRIGTVGYMAPEQVRGLPCDHRADIFSFGCVLYEMLSGQRAFQGATAADVISAILKEDPPPLRDLRQAVSPMLQQIVDRCMEKRPEDRFSSAHDLGLALEAASTGPGRPEGEAGPSGADSSSPSGGTRSSGSLGERLTSSIRFRRRAWLLGGLAAVLILAAAATAVARQRKIAWVRDEALPELVRLAEAHEYWPAFLLARKIEAVVPGDPTLEKLRPRFTGKLEREIRPAGARVQARPRTSTESDWIDLGAAGGKGLPVPLGYSVFRVQSPGLEPREFGTTVTEFNYSGMNEQFGILALARRGEVPDGMVRIDNPAKDLWLGLDHYVYTFAKPGLLGSFFADATEVTNREYKRFVDAGGYQSRAYWKEPFERDGKTLGWDEAMALLRDATGRPGPATWEVGTFRAGQEEFPVTGVSWYEAAAYAEFAGKRLPSVYQWALAAGLIIGGDLMAGSNFSGKLAPAGSYRGGINVWGLYDVAGNAREWCTNASGGERFALGGAADGPPYMFFNVGVTKSPMDRGPTTGFRCIKPVAPDPLQAQFDQPVARIPPPDWSKEKGFSEDVWRSWQGLLSYGRVPLEARTEWTDDAIPTWRMEKVSFAAAYGNERVVAYLFTPRHVPPPWQAVVWWPGGYAALVSSSHDGRNTLDLSYWDYLVKDGRAVVYPILKGTFERGGRPDAVDDVSPAALIPPVKDISRTLDYLETRTDIRKDRFGYLGLSWGANAGPVVCSIEQRIKAAIFLGGALLDKETLGFSRRCTTAIQMVWGSYDKVGESNMPIFLALGTPADRKRHVMFDADHTLAGVGRDVIRVNLEWFDRHLGTVRSDAK